MTGPAVTLPPEVVIEALRVTDAARCAALEEVLFPGDEPWSAGAFREELRAGHTYLAARIDGELVGYGGVAVVGGPPGAEAEIHTIGVDPAHQGRGIGRAAPARAARGRRRAARDGVPGGPHGQRAGPRALRERGVHGGRPAAPLLPAQRRGRVHDAKGTATS